MIETYKKYGMGLERGLSPIFDLLVERYFETADPENPTGAVTRVREGKIARLSIHRGASTQSRCFVICFFLKFRLPFGLHSSCSIRRPVQHVKNAVQNTRSFFIRDVGFF